MDNEKSELEKKVEEGIYGAPEIKKGEKRRYLGEYKERVIKYLTYEQVIEEGTYPEILEAIKHPQAQKLIIDRSVDIDYAQDYIDLAHKNNISFKRVDSPDFKGDVALVVVGSDAVNIKKRKVLSREERLKKAGISDTIIKNAGTALCPDCWQELKAKAPEELINYNKINWLEKLLGQECINCH